MSFHNSLFNVLAMSDIKIRATLADV
jgi:hypothetical protein